MKYRTHTRILQSGICAIQLWTCLFAMAQIGAMRQGVTTNSTATTSPTQLYDSNCRAIAMIEDRGTKQRWILLRNLAVPAAPAELVPIMIGSPDRELESARSGSCHSSDRTALPTPILHPGERIVLSWITERSEVRLEATALDEAAAGEQLRVRLGVGNRILSAVAISAGHASLLLPPSWGHR